MSLTTIIQKLLEFQNNVKIYHWSTNSYSRHVATDKLFAQLGLLIDKFIEVYQGSRDKKLKLSGKITLSLSNKTDSNMVIYLKNFADWLSIDLQKLLLKDDTDLLNIRDELVANINQTLYLFSFN